MLRGVAVLAASACGGAWAHNYYSSNDQSFLSSSSSVAHCKSAPAVINPDEFKKFRLISSQYETHDTRRFHFSTGDPDASLNLPVASCIVCKYVDQDGKQVIRPYTPISTSDRKGSFELLIKKYPKSKMGTHVFTMKPGEEIEVKGPFEKFKYKPNTYSHIAMVAGGTGITPMYQIIRAVLDNPKDKTHISLIYSNKSRKDILLNSEISELARVYSNFDVYFTLTNDVPRRWLGGVGTVNQAMLSTFLPKVNEKNTMVLVCGPPGMMKAISGPLDYSGKKPQQGPLDGVLKEMGYSEDQVYKF